MRCFIHFDTGFGRIEPRSGLEFPDLTAAQREAARKARDLLLKELSRSQIILPHFFVEISGESGELLALLSLRRVLFDEPIADHHRGLCRAIPYPWLRLNAHLAIQDTNRSYLFRTCTQRERIVGTYLFDAFPENPRDPASDGVKNLEASLHHVLYTRKPHRMATHQRYDIRGFNGDWLLRYWRPINVPVLDHNGEVAAIIHHVEDVTNQTQKAHRLLPDGCL